MRYGSGGERKDPASERYIPGGEVGEKADTFVVGFRTKRPHWPGLTGLNKRRSLLVHSLSYSSLGISSHTSCNRPCGRHLGRPFEHDGGTSSFALPSKRTDIRTASHHFNNAAPNYTPLEVDTIKCFSSSSPVVARMHLLFALIIASYSPDLRIQASQTVLFSADGAFFVSLVIYTIDHARGVSSKEEECTEGLP